MLAAFLGLDIIRRVSRLLHTPLMSLTNAISSIAVVGAIIIAGEAHDTLTHGARRDRRVRLDDEPRQRLPDHRPHARMFKRRETEIVSMVDGDRVPATSSRPPLFILALRWMSQPETARRAVARGRRRRWSSPSAARCSIPRSSPTSGSAIAAVARHPASAIPLSRVPLTAVPERTGLSQAFGGLAAALVGTAKYYLWLRRGRADAVPHGGRRRRGDPRLPHLHRRADGGRQARRSASPPGRSPTRARTSSASRCSVRGRRARRSADVGSDAVVGVSDHHRARARSSACC